MGESNSINTRPIISLADIETSDHPIVGGKASNLSRLMILGLNVPPGFVITVSALAGLFDKAIRDVGSNATDAPQASRTIVAAIKSLEIPADLARAIDDGLQSLGADKPFALRSSAVAEDTAEASFAGVYETILDVRGRDAIHDALKHCLCSFFSERAISYRLKTGADALKPDAAVVVQAMVNSEFSGVMFTTNPVNAHPGEMVVDAAPGLGEAVVSGKVQPDHIVLRKSNGAVKRFKSPRGNEALALDDKMIEALWRTGADIEKSFGRPQDIEWAWANGRLYTLQARPITTLPPTDEPVFTRKMGDQYWTDVISQLTATTGVEWIVEGAFRPLMSALGFDSVASMNFLRIHKSHLYMNTQMARDTISMFPLEARKQFVDAMGSPHDDDYFSEAPYRPILALYKVIRSHQKDERSGLTKNVEALKEWSVTVRERAAEMHKIIESRPGLDRLMALFAEVNRMGVEHFEIIRWGHASYNTSFTDMFRDLCTRWADDDGSLFLAITSHLDENLTLITDIALWESAKELSQIESASQIIRNNDPDRATAILLDTDECREGRAVLSRFIAEYGHRTTGRDFTAKCWADAVEQVVSVIKGLLSDGLPENPLVRAEAAKVRSEQALEIALGRIRNKSFSFLRVWWFKWVSEKTRTFIAYRENQRFTLDRIILLIRRLALAIGAELKNAGVLASERDVFYLKRDELEKASVERGIPDDLKWLIEERKTEHEKNRGVLPPAYIKGDFEFDDPVGDAGILSDGEYSGLAASPGTIKGRARVLKELEYAHTLASGEILVTESTDPAWSAVFMKAAGLVLETGGLLSHGAILAREFGIPAVTHVHGATSTIKTGDLISVDGTRGRVAIIKKSG